MNLVAILRRGVDKCRGPISKAVVYQLEMPVSEDDIDTQPIG